MATSRRALRLLQQLRLAEAPPPPPALYGRAVHSAAPAAAAAAAAAPRDRASGGGGGGARPLLAAAAAALAGGATLAHQQQQVPQQRGAPDAPPPPAADEGFHLLGLEHRRRSFFLYEKRLRELSSPEKIYEYFASQGDVHSGLWMTPADVMRAVVPVYPPRGSAVVRAGSLPGEPAPELPPPRAGGGGAELAELDIDGDKKVSYDEYLLFTALLHVPVDDVDAAFALVDADGSGEIDAAEFSALLAAVHARAARGAAAAGAAARWRSAAPPGEWRDGIVRRFFGGRRAGRGVTAAELRAYVVRLREDLARLEFAWYDWRGRGAISGREFGAALVASARPKHVEGYLARVDAMPPELADAQVTEADFMAWAAAWRQLRALAAALDFRAATAPGGAPPSRAELADVVRRVTRAAPPRAAVELLFYLFDDGAGGINTHHMVQVLGRSAHAGGGPGGGAGRGGGGGGGGGGVAGGGGGGREPGAGASLLECLGQCYRR